MKRLLSFFLTILLTLSLFCASTVKISAATDSKYFEYRIENDEVYIFQINISGDIEIPEKIEGYPVTSVSSNPEDNNEISSIIIPEGVKKIGFCSFENCKSLSKITLPDSLEEIGTDAFKGTAFYNDKSNWENDVLYIGKHLIATKNSLSGEYKIKEGTITIGDKAFEKCVDLTRLIIPKSVKNVGQLLFINCAQLEDITVSKDNKYLSAKDAIIYNKNQTKVLVASGGISGEIALPKTVKSIRDSAFQQCSGFTSINLPNGLEKIGDNAFYACSSLEKINIPDSVKQVGESIIHGSKYYNTKANFDGSVLYVGKHLLQIDDWNPLEGEYTVKDGTLTIADSAFLYCDKLTNVTMPDSVIYLGKTAFCDCSQLEIINLSENLTAINTATFFNCSKLEKITLPKGITRIGASAFYNCTSLKEINIPESVTEIEKNAFTACKSIVEITIPTTIKQIENATFSGCKALKEIAIPKNVIQIGESAFLNCSSLKTLTLPKSLKTIGNRAFDGCNNISKIVYKGTKADGKKITIGKNNYSIDTVPWTYDPEKETPKKNETTSQKVESTISQVEIESESTIKPEKETEKTEVKNKDLQKPHTVWKILLLVGAAVLGIAGGVSAFVLTNKKKK